MTPPPLYKDNTLAIYELLGSGDSARVESMLALYGTFFPAYKHYIPRMRRRSALPTEARAGHIAHYWLVEADDEPVGLTIFRYVRARACGLGIAFAIVPHARALTVEGKRLSAFIIARIMDQLAGDAKRMGDSDFWGLVTEVEHIDLMNHYKLMGMYQLPIEYLEPVFPPEDSNRTREDEIKLVDFVPAILGLTPSAGRRPDDFERGILENFVLAFLVDHYGLPQDHPTVQAVVNSIP